MRNDNFIHIEGWMINDLDLSGNELICYAIIYGFSQDGHSKYMGGLRYLEEWMNVTTPTVLKALSSLMSKGYINKHEVTENKVRRVYYSVAQTENEGTKETLVGGTKESLGGYSRIFRGGTKESLDSNIYNNNINNNLSHHNAREERNYLEEEKQTLMSDRPWQEVVCMNMKMTIAELERHIAEFFEVCACSGVEMHNNAKDLKQHFFNWLKINKNGNNKRGNQQQKSALQVVHEYGEELARKVLTGEYQDSHPAGSPFPD